METDRFPIKVKSLDHVHETKQKNITEMGVHIVWILAENNVWILA